jgi:hypothetical protein
MYISSKKFRLYLYLQTFTGSLLEQGKEIMFLNYFLIYEWKIINEQLGIPPTSQHLEASHKPQQDRSFVCYF